MLEFTVASGWATPAITVCVSGYKGIGMMKYHGSRIACGVLILSLACGFQDAFTRADEPAAAAAAEQPLRLLFISPVIHEEFFLPVKRGMHDAAEKMGVEATFTGTEGVDTKAQAAMVTQAVRDGYDGIAVDIIHATDFDKPIADAIAAGVPVVAFNTDDVTPNPRLSTVSQKLHEAGRTVATRALDFIPDGSEVLVTMHDAGVSSLEERRRGVEDVLKQRGIRWSVVVTTPHPEKARDIITAALQDNPKIKTVLCTGQADTEGAGLAIAENFRGKGYRSAGFDLSPNILRLLDDGIIEFTIDQQPYTQGFYPVVQLTLLLRYGIRPSDIDAGAAVITRKEAKGVIGLKARNYR
ncbi:MAG TPA: substrate-binding domain-containing protein [Thermoguttaceae bacterium]|nr:substrate-binding domain-containing protein [Thermoguttaceae bacterium]